MCACYVRHDVQKIIDMTQIEDPNSNLYYNHVANLVIAQTSRPNIQYLHCWLGYSYYSLPMLFKQIQQHNIIPHSLVLLWEIFYIIKLNLQQLLYLMKSINKLKPIPYSKLVNTQLLTAPEDNDDFIPEEHQSLYQTLNLRRSQQPNKKSRNKPPTNTNQSFKTINYAEINAFNRTFATVVQSTHDQQGNKRLTHGLTSYKDIKSSHMMNSFGRDSLKSNNKSGSKANTQLKLDEDCLTGPEKQAIECTFTPKTNSNAPFYKNFKDFVNFQENFLTKRQEKIKKLKQQRDMKECAEVTAIPEIDRKSRKISDSAEEYLMDSYGSLKKIKNKTPVYERLYNIPRKKDRLVAEQGSFTPKILNKSKNLIRKGKVEELLYEDAQRRKQQQELMKTQQYKKQQEQMRMQGEGSFIGAKQNKLNNCKLICNKIKSEFIQLLQNQCQFNQWNQTGSQLPKFYLEKNQVISPILAVTVISELFNIELNPNKNQDLCCKVINYLITDQKNETKQTFTQYVETNKLWDFVKAILGGMDAFQKQSSTFSSQQIKSIHEELGYFYSMRLTKQNTRMNDEQIDQGGYKIEVSQTTNRLAEIHRTKKLQKITQFISDTKIESINKILNYKQKHHVTETDERIIRLEDLFILDEIRKRAQLEQKRIKNQQNQLNSCSFRPSLNEKSIQKAKQRKNRSKKNLTIVPEAQEQDSKQNLKLSKEKGKKIVIKSKIPENKILEKSTKHNVEGQNKASTCQNIKNVDKTLLRLNIARKMRDIQHHSKQRGYKNHTQNWLKESQKQKKQAQTQIQRFLGYQQKTGVEQLRPTQNSKQNEQTA